MDDALAKPGTRTDDIDGYGPSLPPPTYTPGDMDQAIEQGNWEALAAGAAAVMNHDDDISNNHNNNNNNNNNTGRL